MTDETVEARVASRHGLTVEGLRQRLRNVRAEKRNDPSLCRYCEGPLPLASGRKRHTCSATCRTSLSRDRAEAAQRGVEPW